MPMPIQLRRKTAERWEDQNPVLRAGEPGVEVDTNSMKVGDGTTAWNDLDYVADGSQVAHASCTQEGSGATGQSLDNNTETAITWDIERRDTNGYHSTLSNTSRFTADVAGLYRITATLGFTANATGVRELLFKKNGAVYLPGAQNVPSAGASHGTYVTGTAEVELAAGDYVEVIGFQNSGGALTLFKGDALSPEVRFTFLGRFL